MISTRRGKLWQKFAKSKKYREEFVAAQVRQGIPFQIRTMMKGRRMSQEELAIAAGVDQSTISRAIDPEYGKLNLATIIKIAAGFDVAFIGAFVPFSKLDDWFSNLSERQMEVLPFDAENESKETNEESRWNIREPDVRDIRLGRKPAANDTVRAGSMFMPAIDQSFATAGMDYQQRIGGGTYGR
jgi:transcriptional regulator with XRE-family HTH domain